MKRTSTALLAVAALTVSVAAAHAAPPTVTPSPGYDARLQEQRSATAPVVQQPVAPVPPSPPKHTKKKSAN